MSCIEPGCVKEAQRKQLCWPHYDLMRGRKQPKVNKECRCGKAHYARGMCKSCYMVWFRSQDKEDTFTPFALHPKHLNDFWDFVVEELEITGASNRKEIN